MNEELTIIQQEDENSLSHYGVKGQKWGQRNYQNPDGTYTELGKIRRRVAFTKAEKAAQAEKAENQNGSTEETGEKIGGKAYKDMTRKELRAAKRRARHNEKERRAQREFNRDKREAIENGDMSFISKNISKFSNDEIDEAVVRLKKMQAIQDLEDAQNARKQKSEKYIDKAIKFLDKASSATGSITNIYNKINESQQKSIQKKKLWQEYDKLANPKKSALESLKETLDIEKTQKELDELRNGKKKTTKEIYEEEKAQKDLDKLRNPESDWEYVNKKLKDESFRRSQEEIERSNRYKADQEKYKAEKAKADWWKSSSSNKPWSEDDNYDWLDNISFGSNKKGKASKNSDNFDLDEKTVNKINQKYIGKLKESPKDYFKVGNVDENQWRKDMNKHDAKVVDKWVKDMKKKYMDERNMDAKAAEEKAMDYVDSWLEAYDEELLKELKKYT